MTDYRQTPMDNPWARDLRPGDLLTSDQASFVCETRLEDFGLKFEVVHTPQQFRYYRVVKIDPDETAKLIELNDSGNGFDRLNEFISHTDKSEG